MVHLIFGQTQFLTQWNRHSKLKLSILFQDPCAHHAVLAIRRVTFAPTKNAEHTIKNGDMMQENVVRNKITQGTNGIYIYIWIYKWHIVISSNGGTPKSSIFVGCFIKQTTHWGVPPFQETLHIMNTWHHAGAWFVRLPSFNKLLGSSVRVHFYWDDCWDYEGEDLWGSSRVKLDDRFDAHLFRQCFILSFILPFFFFHPVFFFCSSLSSFFLRHAVSFLFVLPGLNRLKWKWSWFLGEMWHSLGIKMTGAR